MKTIFEFLYYCLYRMFALIKRVGEKDENLASWFYSVLLFTHVLTFSLFIKFSIKKGIYSELIYKGTGILLLLILYYFCKYYFLKKENYIRIINKYEEKYPDKKIIIAIIGIAYSLFTFLSFPATVSILSNISYNIR